LRNPDVELRFYGVRSVAKSIRNLRSEIRNPLT